MDRWQTGFPLAVVHEAVNFDGIGRTAVIGIDPVFALTNENERLVRRALTFPTCCQRVGKVETRLKGPLTLKANRRCFYLNQLVGHVVQDGDQLKSDWIVLERVHVIFDGGDRTAKTMIGPRRLF